MKRIYYLIAAMAVTSCPAGAAEPVISAELSSETVPAINRFAEKIAQKPTTHRAPEGGSWKVIGEGTFSDQLIVDSYNMYEAGSQWAITIEQSTTIVLPFFRPAECGFKSRI
ncbi:MAG: hypothetical protein Q4C34_09705, partial [Bacteroidales bacterium]|nr:hypothetical protein [Bacteroidales bacterium]